MKILKKIPVGIIALIEMLRIHGEQGALDKFVYKSRGKGRGLPQHCPNHLGKPGKNYPHHSKREVARNKKRAERLSKSNAAKL